MSNINFFQENGLTVIPVEPKGKRPTISGWQHRKFKDNNPNEFHSDSNYGVVLGEASGIIDIDLDTALAIRLAPYFLPQTGWQFGRRSAPNSHWIYRLDSDFGRPRKFNVDGKFAEYRANGAQTVFPPSIHGTSGELIEFSALGELGTSSQGELIEALSSMAACAAIVSAYQEGKRHEITLALTGTLLAAGKSPDPIHRLVEALCDVTNDAEKTCRLNDVRTTVEKHKSGEPYTQRSKLAELISEECVRLVCQYLSIPDTHTQTVGDTCAVLLDEADRNDTGIAKAFAKHVRGKLIFVNELGCFFNYDDGIWHVDPDGLGTTRVFDEFIEVRIDALRQDRAGVSARELNCQTNFLLKYRNRKNAQNAIHQGRSFLSVPVAKLDCDKDILVVQNGVVNLRTGELLNHSSKRFITKRLDVEFDPNAECLHFQKLLSDAFQGDEQLIRYMQGKFGYYLTGRTDRQEIDIYYGGGANGKSTLINSLSNVLGSYSSTLMSETLFEGLGNHQVADLASMIGVRLAVVHEAESKFRLNAPRVKQLTGGDTIKVKPLYKNPFEMKPEFKIVVLCNRRPNIDAYDDALKLRIKLIPFDYAVPKEKRDPRLLEKLFDEASGILRFMIEGARTYYAGKIVQPKPVSEATKAYVNDHDSVRSFLRDCTVQDQAGTVSKSEFFDAYVRYCAEEMLNKLKKGQFGKILKGMSYEDTRGANERKWKGLRIREDDELDAFPPQAVALQGVSWH